MTDNQILGMFFQIINVTGVSSVINGEIFIGEKPLAREFEDVVINILSNKREFNNQLINGIVNINCFTKENSFHVRDAAKIDTITSAVFTALNLVLGYGNFGLLNYKLVSQKSFRDNDNPLMYYSNIKLDFSLKQ